MRYLHQQDSCEPLGDACKRVMLMVVAGLREVGQHGGEDVKGTRREHVGRARSLGQARMCGLGIALREAVRMTFRSV